MHKNENSPVPPCTRHAVKRCQQRGIRSDATRTVWDFGDREVPVPGGCFRLSISSSELNFLVQRGIVSAKLADQCARLALITDGSTIITSYKQDN